MCPDAVKDRDAVKYAIRAGTLEAFKLGGRKYASGQAANRAREQAVEFAEALILAAVRDLVADVRVSSSDRQRALDVLDART